jgi:hypothetical protein
MLTDIPECHAAGNTQRKDDIRLRHSKAGNAMTVRIECRKPLVGAYQCPHQWHEVLPGSGLAA